MPMTGRAVVGCVLAALVATSCAGPDPTRAQEPDGPPAPDGYRFVSSPDFMNLDVADLRETDGWRPGMPNSWNDAYADVLDGVMDAFEAERPDDVLVAGDLVNGHWGRDDEEVGVFGPVGTEAERRAAVTRAAEAYYGTWRGLFDDRGLETHVAVGDHEIGDNPWSGSRVAEFKQRNIGLFKDLLADEVLDPDRYESRPPGPANRTAYATRLDPDVLLVTVDVFERTRNGVRPRLDDEQLDWLDDVLAGAEADGVEWTIVQGHTPVLGPVRQTSSSGLTYSDGAASPFWRTMARHGVDLYLSGEVHDITTRTRDGVLQVSHGGMLGHAARTGRGGTNYLVGEVDGDRLTLTSKRFRVLDSRSQPRLWQVSRQGRPPAYKVIDGEPDVIGELTLASDGGIVDSSGSLEPLAQAGS